MCNDNSKKVRLLLTQQLPDTLLISWCPWFWQAVPNAVLLINVIPASPTSPKTTPLPNLSPLAYCNMPDMLKTSGLVKVGLRSLVTATLTPTKAPLSSLSFPAGSGVKWELKTGSALMHFNYSSTPAQGSYPHRMHHMHALDLHNHRQANCVSK